MVLLCRTLQFAPPPRPLPLPLRPGAGPRTHSVSQTVSSTTNQQSIRLRPSRAAQALALLYLSPLRSVDPKRNRSPVRSKTPASGPKTWLFVARDVGVHTFLYIKGYRGNVRRLDTTDGPVTDTAHERHTRTIYFSLDSLTHAHTTTSSLACARSCFLGHSLSLSLSRSTCPARSPSSPSPSPSGARPEPPVEVLPR